MLVANGVGGASVEADWALLILLGPAIPLYLVVLPLLPVILRALRHGWTPRPIPIVVATLLVSAAIDAVFWVGRP